MSWTASTVRCASIVDACRWSLKSQASQVEYCPHCLNMGGVALVSNNRVSVWPTGNKGGPAVCGEAYNAANPQYQLNGGSVDSRRYNRIWAKRIWGANYRAGQRILVRTNFYTYHRGMVQVGILCRLPL